MFRADNIVVTGTGILQFNGTVKSYTFLLLARSRRHHRLFPSFMMMMADDGEKRIKFTFGKLNDEMFVTLRSNNSRSTKLMDLMVITDAKLLMFFISKMAWNLIRRRLDLNYLLLLLMRQFGRLNDCC